MTPAIEIFYQTCIKLLTPPNKQPHTYEEFQEKLRQDPEMKEGVDCVVQAMELYAKLTLEEIASKKTEDLPSDLRKLLEKVFICDSNN